jgi:DNA-binding response OmpR family regulator
VRILVIEDERDLALGLRANLEVEGYEVAVAHTGEDGLQLAEEWTPDLVLLDLMLPGIDGYETLGRLRNPAPTCRCSFSPHAARKWTRSADSAPAPTTTSRSHSA